MHVMKIISHVTHLMVYGAAVLCHKVHLRVALHDPLRELAVPGRLHVILVSRAILAQLHACRVQVACHVTLVLCYPHAPGKSGPLLIFVRVCIIVYVCACVRVCVRV